MPNISALHDIERRGRLLLSFLLDRLCGDLEDDAAWQTCGRAYLTTLMGTLVVLLAFVLLVDPYNVVPFSPPAPRPIMDVNQRFYYPGVIRSRRYDSFVIGSSTSRLLDPKELDSAFGGHFANLAMSAATPWEEMEVSNLFLREMGPPRAAIIGIDSWWCDPKATEGEVTFRGFPEWMYDANRWNDLRYLLNGKTVEISGRLVGYWLGLLPERMREDGYSVFVPPESRYNPKVASAAIWNWGGVSHLIEPVVPPVRLSAEQRNALQFPAMVWLKAYLRQLKGNSQVIIAVMPTHIAIQPAPGSEEAANEQECFSRMSAIASETQSTMVNWRIKSPLTSVDTNYWDPFHYRLGIASQIVKSLAEASRTGEDPADGKYKVSAFPGRSPQSR